MELTASKDELTGRWNIPELEPSEKTFERMCEMLRENIPFKFARYGDGEFFCMSGKSGHNCDKHDYFMDLGLALSRAFYDNPSYMVGIQPLSVHSGLYRKASDWLTPPKNIYNADVLHNASIDGDLQRLFKAVQGRPVVVVGPAHLSTISDKFIEIPGVNCWNEYGTVCKALYKVLDGWKCIEPGNSDDKQPVVLLCASMMSEVIIHRFQNHEATFIDCGSVFDPYYGKLSRSYHHKLKL